MDSGHDASETVLPAFTPLSDDDARQIRRRIQRHGGIVCNHIGDAQVIIVDEKMVNLYQFFYRFSHFVHAQSPAFISECITNGQYSHKQPKRKAMGGRPGERNGRREFTARDDRFLVKYIATRIPVKEAGGRGGNGLYQELEMHWRMFPRGPWALGQNHTWQSWRERYVKNQPRFDDMIDDYVARRNLPDNGKALYCLDRRLAVNRLVKQAAVMEGEESEEEVRHNDPPRRQKRLARTSVDSSDRDMHAAKRARPVRGDVSDENNFELNVEPQEPLEDQNRAGPSGTQRSPTPSSPASRGQRSARPIGQYSVTVINSRPRPQPTMITQNSLPASSQITLVNPTQHSPRGPSTAQQQHARSKEPTNTSEPEPRQPQLRPQYQATPHRAMPNTSQATPRRPLVILSRLQDILRQRANARLSSAQPQELRRSGSGPPGNVSPAPEVNEGEAEGIVRGDEDLPDNAEEEEIIPETPQDDSEEELDQSEQLQGWEILSESSDGDSAEVDQLMSPTKGPLGGEVSESDLRAFRSVMSRK
ncbi:hypothetical protein BC835DRAFT_1354014 [Cytidiella melzeri]|nr:hypothetical protein BC835DRAFT_1354014 [Cytidiella melzeri]